MNIDPPNIPCAKLGYWDYFLYAKYDNTAQGIKKIPPLREGADLEVQITPHLWVKVFISSISLAILRIIPIGANLSVKHYEH